MKVSGYRLMWMQVIFDLPVQTATQRKAATLFRKNLLDLGFTMEQFSVYFRHLSGQEQAESYEKKVLALLPTKGQVSVILITDKQYEKIKTFSDRNKSKKQSPDQLLLF